MINDFSDFNPPFWVDFFVIIKLIIASRRAGERRKPEIEPFIFSSIVKYSRST